MGHPHTELLVGTYVADATSTCFVDAENEENSAYARYEASQDDLVVIGRLGRIRARTSTVENSLTTDGPRAELDELVRKLLAE